MRPTTSASNLFRRSLCPGSARLEAGLPEEDSEQSREGQLLHDYSAHPEYERRMLKPAQRDLLELADTLTKTVMQTCVDYWGLTGPWKEDREIPLKTKEGLTGTPDLIRFYWDNNAIVIVDEKYGFNVVERADVNLQTRVYAIMGFDTGIKTKRFLHGEVRNICVGIVQPRASYEERITLAYYTPEDIEASREQIKSILAASEKPDAPLVAGEEQCRYCKAKLICPAFRETMLLPAVLTPDNALSKTAREAYLAQRLAECSDEQLGKVVEAIKLLPHVKELANDEARKRIAAGAMTNYELGKEFSVREIADVRKALSLLSLADMDKTDVYDCITGMAIGKLEEKVRAKNPGYTQKLAKEWINKRLKSVIEIETRKPRIIRK